MHLKTKTINGAPYWYVVESYREAGKVKQRNLAYLGPAPQFFENQRRDEYSLKFALEWFLQRFAGEAGEVLTERARLKKNAKVHKLSPRFKRRQRAAHNVMSLIANAPEPVGVHLNDRETAKLVRGLELKDYKPRA